MNEVLTSPAPCPAASDTTSAAPGTHGGTADLAPGHEQARLDWLFRRDVNDQQPHPLRPLIQSHRQKKAGDTRG